MMITGLLREAIDAKHREALQALAVVESYLMATTPGLAPKQAPETAPIEPPPAVKVPAKVVAAKPEPLWQVEPVADDKPEPVPAVAKPPKIVLGQPTFKQRTIDWMKGKGPQFIGDIAKGAGLEEAQVYAVLMNNKKDFAKIGNFAANASQWTIASEAPPPEPPAPVAAAVPVAMIPSILIPEPAPVPEPKPAAPPEVPDLLKKESTTEETDDEARDRIYKFVEVYGTARPVMIAQSLNMTLDRTQQLLNHAWFQKDLTGYSIARRSAE